MEQKYSWKEFIRPNVAKVGMTVVLYVLSRIVYLPTLFIVWYITDFILDGAVPLLKYLGLFPMNALGAFVLLTSSTIFANVIFFYFVSCVILFIFKKVQYGSRKKAGNESEKALS